MSGPARTFVATLSLVIFILAGCVSSKADDLSLRAVRIDVGGYKLNSVLLDGGRKADLPPIVFLHGASASLYDPVFSFRDKLDGRAKLLFVDRPGHGNSDKGGRENILPDGQADAIAILMSKRGVQRAIVVGHSLGGAIAVALAARHPELVSGLVLMSPAAYPWKGGVAWYYDVAGIPFAGSIFSALVAPPVGLIAIDRATKQVFAPNPRPDDYIEKTKAWQALCKRDFPRTLTRTIRRIALALGTASGQAVAVFAKLKGNRSSISASPAR